MSRPHALVMSGLVAFALFSTSVAEARAQFSGEDARIPEAPGANWTTEFIGWPLFLVALALTLGVIIYYTTRMSRVRHVRRT